MATRPQTGTEQMPHSLLCKLIIILLARTWQGLAATDRLRPRAEQSKGPMAPNLAVTNKGNNKSFATPWKSKARGSTLSSPPFTTAGTPKTASWHDHSTGVAAAGHPDSRFAWRFPSYHACQTDKARATPHGHRRVAPSSTLMQSN